jgi:hypothetical protein
MAGYTENQKISARETDIVEFLRQTVGFDFKRSGAGYRCVSHDSLFVYPDKKGSRGVGGANAIDWCVKINGMTFPQAMGKIVGAPDGNLKQNPRPVQQNARQYVSEIPAQKAEFALPEKAPTNNRALAYLSFTRQIDKPVLTTLIDEKSLFQDARGNAVFVGRDGENKPSYAFKRSTLTYGGSTSWRGEQAGSKKEFGFKMNGADRTKVYVFESPIDALSHASLANFFRKSGDAWRENTRLSLGGVTDRAVAEDVRQNPECKEIIFCLDNDRAGVEASENLMKKYAQAGFSVRKVTPKNKDFNEDLCRLKQQNTAVTRARKSPSAAAV